MSNHLDYMTHKVRANPFRLNKLSQHYILEESNFNFRYVGLCDLEILREQKLNYLQTVETLISKQLPVLYNTHRVTYLTVW